MPWCKDEILEDKFLFGLAFCLTWIEKQTKDKRVESIFATCLDEGSTPSNSTIYFDYEYIVIFLELFFVGAIG